MVLGHTAVEHGNCFFFFQLRAPQLFSPSMLSIISLFDDVILCQDGVVEGGDGKRKGEGERGRSVGFQIKGSSKNDEMILWFHE